MLDTHKETSTPRLVEKTLHGSPQDRLNLRPLPRPLGHNGPYLGAKSGPFFGSQTPLDRDCDRIKDHSDLFRSLDSFETDLREAITRVWRAITEAQIASDVGAVDQAEITELTADATTLAFRYMQEAYLIAEVINEREKRRIREQEGRDFLSLIPTALPSEMTALERLAEQSRIEWQISKLLDRLADHGIQRVWPTHDVDRLQKLNERLEAALQPMNADQLNSFGNDELAEELSRLETQVSQIRRQITVIHAIRTIRHA